MARGQTFVSNQPHTRGNRLLHVAVEDATLEANGGADCFGRSCGCAGHAGSYGMPGSCSPDQASAINCCFSRWATLIPAKRSLELAEQFMNESAARKRTSAAASGRCVLRWQLSCSCNCRSAGNHRGADWNFVGRTKRCGGSRSYQRARLQTQQSYRRPAKPTMDS